jgi:hypothetical protein
MIRPKTISSTAAIGGGSNIDNRNDKKQHPAKKPVLSL